MTPVDFQKQIRLHEARARLLTEAGDVAGVVSRSGTAVLRSSVASTGGMFGVPPSRDAIALRAAAE